MKKSLLAGMLIGLAATVYLTIGAGSTFGAVLFSFGLLSICVLELDLYTGKIGFILNNDINIKEYLIMLLGNLIGTMVICSMTAVCNTDLQDISSAICESKFQYNLLPFLFLKGILCGILMWLAVNLWKKSKGSTTGVLGIACCVAVFILSGYEHSIADMAYTFLTYDFGLIIKSIPFLIVVILGNTLGSIGVNALFNIPDKKDIEKFNLRYFQSNTEILKAGKLTEQPYEVENKQEQKKQEYEPVEVLEEVITYEPVEVFEEDFVKEKEQDEPALKDVVNQKDQQ